MDFDNLDDDGTQRSDAARQVGATCRHLPGYPLSATSKRYSGPAVVDCHPPVEAGGVHAIDRIGRIPLAGTRVLCPPPASLPADLDL